MRDAKRYAKAPIGHTMIELLVVLAVLGVLAALLMPVAEATLVSRKEQELREALWQLRHALDDYKAAVESGQIARRTESGYPPNLEVLEQGVERVGVPGEAGRLHFLRSVPRDPFADPAAPAVQTWRLRSHASPPDRPAPGADVFDVHSASSATALDGTPYSRW